MGPGGRAMRQAVVSGIFQEFTSFTLSEAEVSSNGSVMRKHTPIDGVLTEYGPE
jgi:hypothetical protein